MAFCFEDLACCLGDNEEEPEEVKEHISLVPLTTGDWSHPPSHSPIFQYWGAPDEGNFTLEWTGKEHDGIIACSGLSSYLIPPASFHHVTVPVEEVHKEDSERNDLEDISCWMRHFGAPDCAKLSVLNDWATTLRSCHAIGVVHGNLTPMSVDIVHGKGTLNTLAVSQPTRMTRTRESLADDGTDVYSARWAATEFFRLDNGDPHPTKMSDVYSFACLMLQVLTGNVPYCATKRPEQVVYLKYLGRDPIDAQTPEVADRYVAFMRWCWSPEPEKRPSMETVVDFIEGEINRFQE